MSDEQESEEIDPAAECVIRLIGLGSCVHEDDDHSHTIDVHATATDGAVTLAFIDSETGEAYFVAVVLRNKAGALATALDKLSGIARATADRESEAMDDD